jgi:hypothetical protein
MKKLIHLLSILFALTAMFAACEKIPEKPPVCDVENPLTDLPWLKAKIDEFNLLVQENPYLSVAIYQCKYGNNETGFLIDEGNMKPFYNCKGEVLCIMGGVAGETCSELNIDFENKKLIWEIKPLAEISEEIWEWKCIYDTNIVVRLTISGENVYVSKSPKEDGHYDTYHQFRDETQYLLQNDTLHQIVPPYYGHVSCPHYFDFIITKRSDDKMELEYNGPIFAGLLYMHNYLFNRIK